MAIVLKKNSTIPEFFLYMVDTVQVYVNDVLVETASGDGSLKWQALLLDGAVLPIGNDAHTVIELVLNESVSITASYPSLTDSASVDVKQVTFYIPGEPVSPSAAPPDLSASVSIAIQNVYHVYLTETVSASSTFASVGLSDAASIGYV